MNRRSRRRDDIRPEDVPPTSASLGPADVVHVLGGEIHGAMQWRKADGTTGHYAGPPVELGYGIPRRMRDHGIRRALYDVAFGYVSGFPITDILTFSAQALFPHRQIPTVQAERVASPGIHVPHRVTVPRISQPGTTRLRPRMYVDGYELQPAAIGWHIRLRHAWTDNTPSLVMQGAWWAFTATGAHRKAHRLITRDRRHRARVAATQEYDA